MGDIGDPYDALVQLAQPSDVDAVVADGRILRRNGAFTALRQAPGGRGAIRDRAEEQGELELMPYSTVSLTSMLLRVALE